MLRFLRLVLFAAVAVPCLAEVQAVPVHPPALGFGDSVIPLAGPWKFSPGDSPAWAQPGFDDSAWASMDLHASDSSADPGYGSRGYLTGWTARGFPGLSGFAWYRLRIHVDRPAQPLWIKMPDHVDDSYQVFANGRLIGQFGVFTLSDVKIAGDTATTTRVDSYLSRPLLFQLPPPDASGDITLALRFYMEPRVLVLGTTPDSGGMHDAPLVGFHAQLESIRRQQVQNRILSITSDVFLVFVLLIAAAGALWIWLIDRDDRTYLWLLLALLLGVVQTPISIASLFTYLLYQYTPSLYIPLLTILQICCWIFFWRNWFRLGRNRAADLLLAVLALVGGLGNLGLEVLFNSPASAHLARICSQIIFSVNIAFGGVLVEVLFRGARKSRTEALIALPPVLLLVIGLVEQELLNWFRRQTTFFPFGIGVSVAQVSSILMVLVIGALVARRFVSTRVEERLARQSVAQELEQARELQQHVLIPEPFHSALFQVATEYHPARSVGGDFFQVIPAPVGSAHEGSLLIVVGDVSGKGMAAAMLVAVLVGTVRTEADHTFDPAAILQALNARLLGRAGGHFATCIAAHLLPDRTLRLANAGHLPPYLNGRALQIDGQELTGSLPLGLDALASYEVESVHLAPGDRLIFLTDGVPEARDRIGKLLGFDRTEQLCALSPAGIAGAAIDHAHGHPQDDDITVLGVSVTA